MLKKYNTKSLIKKLTNIFKILNAALICKLGKKNDF